MPEVVLVTGAAGFVGSYLLDLLSHNESTPLIVGWKRPQLHSKKTFPPPRSFSNNQTIRWKEIDLLDKPRVTSAIAKLQPSMIYHCAGVANVLSSWTNVTQTLEGNIRSTQFLLDGISLSGCSSRVLIPGSALIYKPSSKAIRENDPIGPVSPYGLSKLAQEMLGYQFFEQGLNVLLTRSFTHIGAGQAPSYAASSFAYQIAQIEANDNIEPVIHVGSLDTKRDLMDVRDTVLAYQALMEGGNTGTPYNVCSGQAHRIGDVLENLLSQSQVSIKVKIDNDRLRPQDNQLLLGDPSLIQNDVGWKSHINLTDTLRDLLNYWRTTIRPA